VTRGSVAALPTEQALALFDAALAGSRACLVPVKLDAAALRSPAGDVPPMLRGLVRAGRVRRVVGPAGGGGDAASASAEWRQRLAGLPEAEQTDTLVQLVRTEAATVLGHATPSSIGSTHAFKDLGFDSLTSVELRNRLGAAVGLRLPSTLVFDRPTPAAVAEFLKGELAAAAPEPAPAGPAAGGGALLAQLDGLKAAALGTPPDDATRTELAARLKSFLHELTAAPGQSAGAADDDEVDLAATIDDASDDDLFAFIDNEL
jgi:polyketide synthase 12